LRLSLEWFAPSKLKTSWLILALNIQARRQNVPPPFQPYYLIFPAQLSIIANHGNLIG